VARASTFGIASARIITASMPMRRSRRNIEKKGGTLVGQSVPVSCFSTVNPLRVEGVCSDLRLRLVCGAHAIALASLDVASPDVNLRPASRVSRPGRRHGTSRNAPRTNLGTKPHKRNARLTDAHAFSAADA
jgi:hypothetical protein